MSPGPEKSTEPEGDATLPRPSGSHTVGCTDVEFRSEGGRHILARLFYPADASTRYCAANRATWLPSPAYYPGYGYYLRVPGWISGVLFRYMAGHVQLWAVDDASPNRSALRGLVVFSHGVGGIRTTYSSICTELASHGFLVGAVEHRDGSAAMSVDGFGRTIQYQPPTPNNEFNFRSAQLKVRAEEIEALLALLASGKRHAEGSIKGNLAIVIQLIGSQRPVALVGHSMGGASVFLAAASLPLVERVVGLDPWMYPLPANLSPAPSTRPTLALCMETFEWPDNDARIADYLSQQKLDSFLTVERSDHADQSDVAAVMPWWVRVRMRTRGSIDPLLVLGITRQFVLEYLVKGTTPESSHVVVGSRHRPA